MSSKKEKKRKQEETGDSSAKRKKITSNDDKPISVSILKDSGPLRPCFISSPGLELQQNLSYTPYVKEKTSTDRKGTKTTHEILLHSADHPRLDYVGREPPRGSFGQLTKHYVGVYDPVTSSLQLVPAKQLTVQCSLKHAFAVDQKLAAAEVRADEDALNGAEEDESAGAKYLAAKNALGDAFGTKKAKKAMRSAAANSLTMSSGGVPGGVAMTEHTQALLASAGSSNMLEGDADDGGRDGRKTVLSSLVNDAHPRPTPNMDAETPADVYRLSSVIGKQELDLTDITPWATALNGGEDIQTQSRYVSGRFAKIAGLRDDKKLKALRFLHLLIQLTNALERRGQSLKLPKKGILETELKEFGNALLQKVKQKFVPGGSNMNQWDVQRLMLHICAIAVVLDDCKCDIKALQEDLRLTSTEIKQYFKQLGCKIDKPSEKDIARSKLSKAEALQHQIAKLTVPFSLPEVREKRMRR